MSNPIIKGYYADPDIGFFNGKFYLYPTTDGGEDWNGTYFKAFSSKNLTDWTDEGIVLDLKDVPWTQGKRAWAPAICERNGKYYLYYSGNRNIGVAVSDSPTGVFRDKGEPLVAEDAPEGQMIDPDVFIDEDGSAYLYWGNCRMYAAKLKENMIELDGEIMDITPPDYIEGSCIFKRKGVYYFTWCKGDTRSPDYHVRYGTGTTPIQKPVGNTVILTRDNAESRSIKATAHHTIINVPDTDDWYIIYHRFNTELYGEVEEMSNEAGNHRELCIDKLEFDENGAILPVKATIKGIDPIKL